MALEVAFLVRFSSGFQFWNLLYKLHKIAVKKFRKSKIRRTLFSAEIFNFWKNFFFRLIYLKFCMHMKIGKVNKLVQSNFSRHFRFWRNLVQTSGLLLPLRTCYANEIYANQHLSSSHMRMQKNFEIEKKLWPPYWNAYFL